jgi:hypothetical protein
VDPTPGVSPPDAYVSTHAEEGAGPTDLTPTCPKPTCPISATWTGGRTPLSGDLDWLQSPRQRHTVKIAGRPPPPRRASVGRSAATGDRRDAWRWTREAVRSNWREPRVAIALAAATGVVRVENVLSALHRRGRGI